MSSLPELELHRRTHAIIRLPVTLSRACSLPSPQLLASMNCTGLLGSLLLDLLLGLLHVSTSLSAFAH
jgi:hypothetical protein